MKQSLTVSIETFTTMLPRLMASGVTFKAIEKDGEILIEFTGGY